MSKSDNGTHSYQQYDFEAKSKEDLDATEIEIAEIQERFRSGKLTSEQYAKELSACQDRYFRKAVARLEESAAARNPG